MIHIEIVIIITALLSNIIIAHGGRTKRIVGGNEINIESAPFMVALEYKNRQICGGAILTRDWILTAAHCFGKVFDIEEALVRVGSDVHQKGGSEHTLSIVFKFPGFNISNVDNDTALMQVYPAVEYSTKVSPIGLPNPGERPQLGEMMTVLGWGYTKEKGEPSEHLRGVSVPVFPHEECIEIYNSTIRVTSQMICLGYADGGRDACVLDSGGPLVKNGTLFGLVSWGWGCARPYRPGVYTDLTTPYLSAWIKNLIKYKFIFEN